jgi:soluble lytic murein transglycosylase
LFRSVIILFLILILSVLEVSAKIYTSNRLKEGRVGKFSREEIQMALSFKKLARELERLKLDAKLVQKLAIESARFNLFENYHPWLRLGYQISMLQPRSGITEFNKLCRIKTPSVEKYPIQNLLAVGLDNICKKKFLELLKKYQRPTSPQLPKLVRTTLRRYINAYLTGPKRLQKEFAKYVASLKVGGVDYRYLSSVIGSQFQRLFPSAQTKLGINKLIVSNSGTGYDKKTKAYFNSEFLKIVSEIQNLVKKSRWLQAEDLVTHLLGHYFQNRPYINIKMAHGKIVRIGKSLLNTPVAKSGLELLNYAVEISPVSEKYESIFYLLWGHLVTGNSKRAGLVVDSYSLLHNFDKLPIKLKFWVAYTKRQIGELKLSTKLFTSISKSNPLDFYSIISIKMLPGPAVEHLSRLEKAGGAEDFKSIPLPYYSLEFNKFLSLVILWDRIGSSRLLNLSLDRLMSLKRADTVLGSVVGRGMHEQEFHRSKISHVLTLMRRQKSYLSMFKVILTALEKQYISFGPAVMRDLFPRPFLPYIKRRTRDNVDPLMVLALMRQESAFNTQARSSAGARGLMQLMPKTARMIKKGVSKKKLHVPSININIGVKLLKRLLKKYDGNLFYTLIAYNAGEGNLRRWQERKIFSNNLLLDLESIPFSETRLYVKLIIRNMFYYRYLGGKLKVSSTRAKESRYVESKVNDLPILY